MVSRYYALNTKGQDLYRPCAGREWVQEDHWGVAFEHLCSLLLAVSSTAQSCYFLGGSELNPQIDRQTDE